MVSTACLIHKDNYIFRKVNKHIFLLPVVLPDSNFCLEFQYGCWGQIGNNDISGKGEPKDDVDKAFRDWHMCRSCAQIDGGGSCQIDDTPYEIGFSPETGRIDCFANPTACANQLCTCDEALAYTLSTLWEEFDTELMAGNGFDHAESCSPKPVVPTGGNGSCAAHEATEPAAQVCCGEYPTRFPFNNKGGCISCCGAKTYNIYNKSCCDNTIQNFGNC